MRCFTIAVPHSHQGRFIRSARQRQKSSEVVAGKILPQGYTIDYTGESRQLPKEANTFVPAFGHVLVGGMTIGTVFTLFFVPAIYLLVSKSLRSE